MVDRHDAAGHDHPGGADRARSHSTSATVRFISTEPDTATYLCRLDGGPQYDCSNPERLTGLGEGPHVFEVKSIDRVGNVQPNWTAVSFSVRLPAVPPSGGGGGGAGSANRPPLPVSENCTADGLKVAIGPLVAVANDGCFREVPGAKDSGVTRYVTKGKVTVNGIPLTPGSGTEIAIVSRTANVGLQVKGPATIDLGPVTWPLPGGMDVDMAKLDSVTFAIPFYGNAAKAVSPKFAGLKLAGNPSVDVTSDKGGAAKIKVALELPEIFKGVPTPGPAAAKNEMTGLSAEFAIGTSNEKGVSFGGKLQLERAWLTGKFPLSKFSLAVDYPPFQLEGTAAFKFVPKSDAEYTLTLGLSEEIKGRSRW